MTRALVVDWPSCRGRGLCHELLPEAIDLDAPEFLYGGATAKAERSAA